MRICSSEVKANLLPPVHINFRGGGMWHYFLSQGSSIMKFTCLSSGLVIDKVDTWIRRWPLTDAVLATAFSHPARKAVETLLGTCALARPLSESSSPGRCLDRRSWYCIHPPASRDRGIRFIGCCDRCQCYGCRRRINTSSRPEETT